MALRGEQQMDGRTNGHKSPYSTGFKKPYLAILQDGVKKTSDATKWVWLEPVLLPLQWQLGPETQTIPFGILFLSCL